MQPDVSVTGGVGDEVELVGLGVIIEQAGARGLLSSESPATAPARRDIVISSRPLEASAFQIENIHIVYVFYKCGLSINVMYTIDDPNKRAVRFKLSEGMEVPAELASQFKFASQKSKLAGTIRGSYFAFKNEY
jgi:hypothetical protein